MTESLTEEELIVPMTGDQDQISVAVIPVIAPEKILTVAVLQDHKENMVMKIVTEVPVHLEAVVTKVIQARDGLVKVPQIKDGPGKATQVKVDGLANAILAKDGLVKVIQIKVIPDNMATLINMVILVKRVVVTKVILVKKAVAGKAKAVVSAAVTATGIGNLFINLLS